MHKKEFIDEITKRTHGSSGDPLTKADVDQVINTALDVITRELRDGGEVRLTGFGTFAVSTRNPTNPQTQQKMGSRQVPVFKAGQPLKDMVREGSPSSY